MYPSSEKRFLTINYITIIALFLLMLAGGVVRSTGSGMGCPDWPKCFDQYIPPTDVAELPADYQQKYVNRRVNKNERFAKSLSMLGYGDLAHRIRNDKSILKPDEFNAAKTWTEYINRLLGAVVGILLIVCVIVSFVLIRRRYLIHGYQYKYISCVLLLIAAQIATGLALSYMGLPPFAQALHILLATLVFGSQFYLLLLLSNSGVKTRGN